MTQSTLRPPMTLFFQKARVLSLKEQSKVTNEYAAQYLKRLRENENLTMRKLAVKVNMPHSFISKLERQGRRLDLGEFVYYCRAMKKNPVSVIRAIAAL